MPRGKATVYGGYCGGCNACICHLRIMKSKKADFREIHKYCQSCRTRTAVKLKEERHSS